jgi:hypothetical protein
MKCAHCEVDSKKKDRERGLCPRCGTPFAFDPTKGDPITDLGFRKAIEAVSAKGTVWFGLEHLRYEVARRVTRFKFGGTVVAVVASGITGMIGATAAASPLAFFIVGGGTLALLLSRIVIRSRMSSFTRAAFDKLWAAWQAAHGAPAGLIVRREPGLRGRGTEVPEPDITDYSFDRAVICDRARTADLLLANNFHFEHNCAVLSADGYPPGVFETVRTMLRRNPRLEVFVLHDATAGGCTLAERLHTSPDWFKGLGRVTDVGLRPAHAARLSKYWIRSQGVVHPGTAGVTADEARWLSAHALELAVLRPEQTLKRLFRAMNASSERGSDSGVGGSGGDGVVRYDHASFGSDAGAGDGGADSFG